jgi:hypothetical protein
MALPLQLDDPGTVTPYHCRLDGRITSTFAAFRQQFRNLAEFSQLVWGQSRDIAGFAVFWFGWGAVTPISTGF